jgi:hypothetical protein
MTTLAADAQRVIEGGDINEHPVIASDIIYEGAAVGLVKASGHAQPLTSSDRFVGFAEDRADNSDGSAADINVRVYEKGKVLLAVSGAVITDEGCAVYASDDNAFSFVKTSGVFIGFFHRYTASGYGIVKFDVNGYVDPFDGLTAETTAADKTLDNEDTGKVIFVTADDKTITLPAVAAMSFTLVNGGAYGTIGWDVAPNGSDLIIYKDSAGTDNHGLVNTKSTAQRQDFLQIEYGDATGWIVKRSRGVFADKDNS